MDLQLFFFLLFYIYPFFLKLSLTKSSSTFFTKILDKFTEQNFYFMVFCINCVNIKTSRINLLLFSYLNSMHKLYIYIINYGQYFSH